MIIPDHFTIKVKQSHGKMKQKLKANGTKIGKIVQTIIPTGPQFQLINVHKNLIAIARKYTTQQGVLFHIFNELNVKIGSIEQIITNSSQKTEKFIIRNAPGQVVAETRQLKYVEDTLDLFDTLNIKIGEMRYKSSTFSKSWDVCIFGHFDRRLLIFVPLFIQNKQSIKYPFSN